MCMINREVNDKEYPGMITFWGRGDLRMKRSDLACQIVNPRYLDYKSIFFFLFLKLSAKTLFSLPKTVDP